MVAAVVPPSDVGAGVSGVLKLIVLDVVKAKGVAAVVLMIQLPPKLCVSDVPPLNVAVPLNVRLPLTVSAPPAVFAPALESVR